MTLRLVEDDYFPSTTHWESTREFNRLRIDDSSSISLFGEEEEGSDDMVTAKDSRTARARVLSNLLAELIIGGIRLKEAGFFGAYDQLRGLTAQIERMYTEFINDDEVQSE